MRILILLEVPEEALTFPLPSSRVKFYQTLIFYTSLPTITSPTTQITLDAGMDAHWNQTRQLNDINVRIQHFSVLDPCLTCTR